MHPDDEDSTFYRNVDNIILYVEKTQQTVIWWRNVECLGVYNL